MRLINFILEPIRNPTTLQTSESRNNYVERFMDSRAGRILGYVPIILILSLQCQNMYAAAWSAWGVNLFLNVLDFYRSRYNTRIVFPNWLRFTVLISMTVIVILVMTIPFDPLLFGPITISTMAGAVLISMIVGNPFTMQQSAHQVTEEVRKSPKFLQFNNILSGFWLVLFSAMTICVWCSFTLCDATCSNYNTCSIVLGTVIPIAIPVIGFLLTPSVVELLKNSEKKNETNTNNNTNNNGGGSTGQLGPNIPTEKDPLLVAAT
jgi:hypothetical protein